MNRGIFYRIGAIIEDVERGSDDLLRLEWSGI